MSDNNKTDYDKLIDDTKIIDEEFSKSCSDFEKTCTQWLEALNKMNVLKKELIGKNDKYTQEINNDRIKFQNQFNYKKNKNEEIHKLSIVILKKSTGLEIKSSDTEN